MDDKTLTRLGLVLIVLGVAGCLLFVGSMMVSEDDEDNGSDLKYTLYMGLGYVSSVEAGTVEKTIIDKLTSENIGFTEFRANGSSSGDGDTEKTLVFILGMTDQKTVDGVIKFAKQNGVKTVLVEKQSADYDFA